MFTVYLATCSALPDGDEEDGALLLDALRGTGLDAHWRVWDDPAVGWTGANLVVVRATWDYTLRRAEFLSWAAGVPGLANPAAVLEWNSDKNYLRDLAAAGVPVVPTTWAPPGTRPELPTAGEFVIKPSVGAGSRGAARFAAADPGTAAAAVEHLDALHGAGRTAMIQPYLADVDDVGETALIYIDGEYSHSIRKGPMLPPAAVNAVDGAALYVEENISPRGPSLAEHELGERVLGVARPDGGVVGDLLYARVDLLPTSDGPVVIELELVEPSLFLSHSGSTEIADEASAADRLAAAVYARIATAEGRMNSFDRPAPSER